jgi:hypothetical protein
MMADTFQSRVVAPVRSALLLSHPTLLTLSRTWQQSGSGGTVHVGAELGGSIGGTARTTACDRR